MENFFYFVSKILNYKLARSGFITPALPINLTFSVTNQCQSRCRTCHIWEIYSNHKLPEYEELSLSEIESIFKSMGKIFFFNISGGCPFLREDLPDIISLACKYLKPSIIHIPTNAINPELIEKSILKILEVLSNYRRKIELSIKPSLDGIGNDHDDIRGVEGNFEKLNLLLPKLFRMREKNKNLKIGVNTILSKMNVKKLPEIMKFVDFLPIDSYVAEIAEKRAEMDNEKEDITPDISDYSSAISLFTEKSINRMPRLPILGKIIESLRLVYYKNSLEILKKEKQIPPCYGAISNAHISPAGEVWACAVLGDKMSLGNLRDVDYDFMKIWLSKKANEVRSFVKAEKCFCPLSNQAYSNMLLSPLELIRAIKYLAGSYLK